MSEKLYICDHTGTCSSSICEHIIPHVELENCLSSACNKPHNESAFYVDIQKLSSNIRW